MLRTYRLTSLALCPFLLAACGARTDVSRGEPGEGGVDARTADDGGDAGRGDASIRDDAAVRDAGVDVGVLDASIDADTGVSDAGVDVDAGGPDSPVYVKDSVPFPLRGQFFGWAVSLSADGTRLAVGVRDGSRATGIDGDPLDVDVTGTRDSSGAVYVFARSGSTWMREAYIKASNSGWNDDFGHSVSLSADGARLAVGAPEESSSATGIDGEQADDSAPGSGAVYVFARSGTTWSQEAYVKASNTGSGWPYGDEFGWAVSLSGDGTRLAVGAVGEDSFATGIDGDQANDGAADAGAVYLFAWSGGTWSQEAYVKASNTDAGDTFGCSVSLSGDGTRLAVGAWTEASRAYGLGGDQDDDSTPRAGAVYVFSRPGAVWSQEAYVKASNTDLGDRFGGAVSLSGDGTRLAAGAYGESSDDDGVNGRQTSDDAMWAGAVYVFARSGATWTQEAYVKASNTRQHDQFGWSLSLSADGAHLAVGAPLEDSSARGLDGEQRDEEAGDSGAIYVFARSGTTWTQEHYVKASNTDAFDEFGYAVSVSADGTELAAGAWHEASNATGVNGDQADNSAPGDGAVYIY